MTGESCVCLKSKEIQVLPHLDRFSKYLKYLKKFEKLSKWTKNSYFFASEAYTTLSHHFKPSKDRWIFLFRFWICFIYFYILDALIEAIESGTSSIDYMDDVGQTLLNWASAFGTQEMVEYLCQKGADVNKGQRSSSLHYAACFGRPQIAKVLLRFGANPDLRDEDGMIN